VSEEHDDESTAAGEPGDEASFRDRQHESWERWRAMREEFERQQPELAKVRAEYAGWLVGFLDVNPATGTAEGVRVEDPAGAPR
jgi:hypothetical protein